MSKKVNAPGEQRCCACKVTRRLDDFYVDKSRSCGHGSRCKSCLKAYAKAKDAANPEKMKQRQADWHKKNRAHVTARVREWRKANPEKSRISVINYRARREGAGRLPYGTIPALMRAQDSKCLCCGADLSAGYHVDHIFPLFRGGKNTPDNVQLLCPTCNTRKGYKLPEQFAKEAHVHIR